MRGKGTHYNQAPQTVRGKGTHFNQAPRTVRGKGTHHNQAPRTVRGKGGKTKVNTFITEASTILKFPLKHHFALEKIFSGFRMCGFGVYGISMHGIGMCGTGGCGVWLWDGGVTVQHVRALWGYDVRV